MANFENSVSKVFTASPIDVAVFKCRKICRTENRRNRALFTGQKTFWLPLKLSLLRGSRPKSAEASLQYLTHIVPDFIQIRSF